MEEGRRLGRQICIWHSWIKKDGDPLILLAILGSNRYIHRDGVESYTVPERASNPRLVLPADEPLCYLKGFRSLPWLLEKFNCNATVLSRDPMLSPQSTKMNIRHLSQGAQS